MANPRNTNNRRTRKSLSISITNRCWRICSLRVVSRRRKRQVEEIRRKLAWSRRSGQSSPQSRTQGEFRKSAKLLSIVRTQSSHLDYRLRKTNRLSSQVVPPTWQIKYQGLSGATRVNSRVVFSPKQIVRVLTVTQWSAITIITNRHRREKIKVTCKSY